eukprot:Skav226995  [mRNA]  locus=scaffold4219:33100:34375:+ [translate_table: standard]
MVGLPPAVAVRRPGDDWRGPWEKLRAEAGHGHRGATAHGPQHLGGWHRDDDLREMGELLVLSSAEFTMLDAGW